MKLPDKLETALRILPPQQKALEKLGLRTVEDLLYYFPIRYGDTGTFSNIGSVAKGADVVIFGTISSLKTSKAFVKKIPMSEGTLTDETGKIKLVWFNQPYMAKMVHDGQLVRVEGKVSERKRAKPRTELRSGTGVANTTGGELYMSNPKIEAVKEAPTAVGDSLFVKKDGDEDESDILYPVYSESKGVTSYWIYHAVQRVFKSGVLDALEEIIPEEILEKYSLPQIRTAMIWIHAPKKERDAESARKRFAFQEIFMIQLEKQREKRFWQEKAAFKIETGEKEVESFIARFPWKPTESQLSAIDSIMKDFRRGYPMSRLLEGDVGSGKTAVAAATIYAVTNARPLDNSGKRITGNLQTAYMAPTEILAKQHYENFIRYFEYLPTKVGLITGSECQIFPSKSDPTKPTRISRAQLLKWVANGEVPILIGTHALIAKSVAWKHLAFAVIDEQHRFGTSQRQRLTTKAAVAPHLLSMTATPIPRTLALTIYGDLDLTLLEGMPHGRKPIITKVVMPAERKNTYEEIRKELKAGRQLYVICPRIDEPDPTKELAVLAKSVTLEAERLRKEVFPEYAVGILHSKMTPAEKERVMKDFSSGKIKILVATSVVEVGVNVPNATLIILEGAERFGLSQLHQLRGRVIRSNHQAYCYVFTESNGPKTRERMKAFVTAKNGFELSEFDLAQRGAGELYGRKQWGISDLAMEAIKNIKMVEAAREEAVRIIEKDPELKRFPPLRQYLESQTEKIHFE